jgi:hypothetical protein
MTLTSPPLSSATDVPTPMADTNELALGTDRERARRATWRPGRATPRSGDHALAGRVARRRRLTEGGAAEVPHRSEQATAGKAIVPDRKAIAAATGEFLKAIRTDAPDRAREVLAKAISPITLTPKTEGPDRFVATGTLDLAKVLASGGSGGRI